MKSSLIFYIVCSFVLPTVTLAKSNGALNEKESLDRYYQSLFLGEKKTANYAGAKDPRSSFRDDSGKLAFLDDEFFGHYVNKEIQEDAFDLHEFWFTKIIEKSTCPD
ncbi:MAG: hypothetical protein EHM20_02690, partial [Alphaproteobacteria bacterium]